MAETEFSKDSSLAVGVQEKCGSGISSTQDLSSPNDLDKSYIFVSEVDGLPVGGEDVAAEGSTVSTESVVVTDLQVNLVSENEESDTVSEFVKEDSNGNVEQSSKYPVLAVNKEDPPAPIDVSVVEHPVITEISPEDPVAKVGSLREPEVEEVIDQNVKTVCLAEEKNEKFNDDLMKSEPPSGPAENKEPQDGELTELPDEGLTEAQRGNGELYFTSSFINSGDSANGESDDKIKSGIVETSEEANPGSQIEVRDAVETSEEANQGSQVEVAEAVEKSGEANQESQVEVADAVETSGEANQGSQVKVADAVETSGEANQGSEEANQVADAVGTSEEANQVSPVEDADAVAISEEANRGSQVEVADAVGTSDEANPGSQVEVADAVGTSDEANPGCQVEVADAVGTSDEVNRGSQVGVVDAVEISEEANQGSQVEVVDAVEISEEANQGSQVEVVDAVDNEVHDMRVEGETEEVATTNTEGIVEEKKDVDENQPSVDTPIDNDVQVKHTDETKNEESNSDTDLPGSHVEVADAIETSEEANQRSQLEVVDAGENELHDMSVEVGTKEEAPTTTTEAIVEEKKDVDENQPLVDATVDKDVQVDRTDETKTEETTSDTDMLGSEVETVDAVETSEEANPGPQLQDVSVKVETEEVPIKKTQEIIEERKDEDENQHSVETAVDNFQVEQPDETKNEEINSCTVRETISDLVMEEKTGDSLVAHHSDSGIQYPGDPETNLAETSIEASDRALEGKKDNGIEHPDQISHETVLVESGTEALDTCVHAEVEIADTGAVSSSPADGVRIESSSIVDAVTEENPTIEDGEAYVKAEASNEKSEAAICLPATSDVNLEPEVDVSHREKPDSVTITCGTHVLDVSNYSNGSSEDPESMGSHRADSNGKESLEENKITGNSDSNNISDENMIRSEEVSVKIETKPFNFLVRIPRSDDDSLKEKISIAKQNVEEKTKLRSDIQAQIKEQRANSQTYGVDYQSAKGEGRDVRKLLRSKYTEMDSLQSVITKAKNALSIDDIDSQIQNIEHTIQHETLPLKEEKQLIREIKQLKQLKEQLSSNMGSQHEIKQALEQKEEAEERLEKLRKELDVLKKSVYEAERNATEAEKIYDGENLKFKELQAQYRAADEVRQSAYVELQSLRKELWHKNNHFFKYKDDFTAAINYASERDTESLYRLCTNQVENFMELWNANVEYRKEYIKLNTRSTVRRFGTLDGRSLGLNENPPILPSYVNQRVGRMISTPAKADVTLQIPLTEPKLERTIDNIASSNGKLTKEAMQQKNKVASSNGKPTKEVIMQKNNFASVNGKPTKEAIEQKNQKVANGDASIPVDHASEEEHQKSKEELELLKKDLEMKKAEDEAKLKEQRRLEELAKANEARERKKRQAEKSQRKAEVRAQKEAEQKEKEREKRLKKKERRRATSADNNDDVSNNTAASETSEPSESGSIDNIEPKNVVPSVTPKQPAKTVPLKKKTKSKSVAPPPLRNRKKKTLQQWMWIVGIASLICLFIFLVGNFGALSGYIL